MVSAKQGQVDEDYFVVACVSIFIFDYLETLPREWYAYWKRGWRGCFTSPSALIFMAVRYFTLLNAILTIYVNASGATPFHLCVALVRVPFMCMVMTNFATNCLFTLRVYALSNRDKQITAGLFLLAALQIPPGISYEFGLQSVHLPGGVQGCSFDTNDKVSIPVFYGMGLLFDAAAFGLTVWYLRRSFAAGFWTPLAAGLLRDGLVYMLIQTVINLVNLIFATAPPHNSHLRNFTGPLSFITAVMATRVTLHHLFGFENHGVKISSSYEGTSYATEQSHATSTYGESTYQSKVSFSSAAAPSRRFQQGQQPPPRTPPHQRAPPPPNYNVAPAPYPAYAPEDKDTFREA